MSWTSTVPYSYAIEYAHNRLGSENYLRSIREGKPQLLHTFADTPLHSWAGNAIQIADEGFHHISAEEMPSRINALKDFVRQAHEAGAERMIPYICTMIIVGNAETRDGFWKLYDNWGQFEPFGIGPKPETDPLEWLQTGAKKLKAEGMYHHEPTIHHPAWRRYLTACTDLVAQCGYDGTFLDVNALVSYHEVDRRAFAEYLADRYSKDELADLFEISTPEQVRLGKPGDGLLWFETARFRACAMGKLFAELRDVGRRHVKDFFVIVNNSPMSSVDAFYARRKCGHGLAHLHSSCEAVLFEEMQQPGRFGIDRLCDSVLQLKYALAHGATGVTLLYNATDHDGNMLSNAEAAAGGGGAFVQPGLGRTAEMHLWGEWFRKHAAMYENKESVHHVGVLFFAEQMYWEDRSHVQSVYRLRMALSDNHILFDFLVEPHFEPADLASFEAIIVPHVQYVSREQVSALRAYLDGGGRLLLVGGCGLYDERGSRRERSLQEVLGEYRDRVHFCDELDALVPSRDRELYELPEEEVNAWGGGPPPLPDRIATLQEAQSARNYPLLDVLDKLTGRRLAFLGHDAPYTLRVNAYRDTTDGRILIHMVNYDVPVIARGKSGPPRPARNIRVNQPSKRARLWTPDGADGQELTAGPEGIEVPEVNVYAMIQAIPL